MCRLDNNQWCKIILKTRKNDLLQNLPNNRYEGYILKLADEINNAFASVLRSKNLVPLVCFPRLYNQFPVITY